MTNPPAPSPTPCPAKPTVPIPPLTKKIVKAFALYCVDAHEAWCLVRGLTDRKEFLDAIDGCQDRDFFIRTIGILHRHFLTQVAKLHDKTIVAWKVTMSLNYILDSGGWTKKKLDRLTKLKARLDKHLGKVLYLARNQILSHNDLNLYILSQERGNKRKTTLGNFRKGRDVRYFKVLQTFVTIVYQRFFNGHPPFNEFPHADSAALIHRLARHGIMKIPGITPASMNP